MDIIATQVYENCDAVSSQISHSTQDNKIQVKISSIILIFSFCIFCIIYFCIIYLFSIFNFFYHSFLFILTFILYFIFIFCKFKIKFSNIFI